MANWKKINNKIKSADSFQDIDMTKLKEYVFSRSRAMVMVTTDGLLYNYNYTKDYFEYIDTSNIEDEIKSVKIVGDNIFVTTNTNKLYQVNVSSASKPQDSDIETTPEDSGVVTPPSEDSGVVTPPSEDSDIETTPEDSGVVTPPSEDSGVVTPPSEDSGVETPPEDSGVETPPEDSGVETPPEDSGVETPPNVKEIIINSESSYLITKDNNLYVCGANSSGLLGVGDNTNISTWTKIDIVGIVDNVKEVITNNGYSSYLITLDNNLYVCGRNNYGQLGVGNTTNVSSWTKIDIVGINNNVKEIIINNIYSSYLITNDNNLYVCGRSDYGQLGVGYITNVSTWTKITLTGIINNVKEVIANNNNYSYLITKDNNLYVCGRNNYGQLGVGNTTNVSTWTKIDIEGINNNVKEVITNYLITNDDNLYVCGRNNYGQLGLGNTTDVKTWTKITLIGIVDNVKEVINNYLITLDNNLYVCGSNSNGKIGVGDTTPVLTWTKIDIEGIIDNVKEVIINNSSYLITLDDNLYVCGKNNYGQLGVGTTTDVLIWTKIDIEGINNNVKEVITNSISTYLITNDDNLYVCGSNYFGQLGVGNTTDVLTWTKIDEGVNNNVKEVIINNNSSYLITNNNNLYVCGRNDYGQLGLGDTVNRMKHELIDSIYEDSGVETPPSIDIS